MVQRTFKGIPDCWRTTVWHEFLDTQASHRPNRESESQLIQSYYVPSPLLSPSNVSTSVTKTVKMTHKSTLTSPAQSPNTSSSANATAQGAPSPPTPSVLIL